MLKVQISPKASIRFRYARAVGSLFRRLPTCPLILITIPEAHFISYNVLRERIKASNSFIRFLDNFYLLFDSRFGQPLGQGKVSKCRRKFLPIPRQEVNYFVIFTVHVRCRVG